MASEPAGSAAELERLLAEDTDDLFVSLGRLVSPPLLGFDIGDRPRARWYRNNGERAFGRYVAIAKNKVCSHEKVRAHLRSQNTESMLAIAQSIVSLIEPIVAEGTASIVAVLMVRVGLRKICFGGENA